MLTLSRVEAKNFLSVGDDPVRVELDSSKFTIVVGQNGFGKCVSINTKVRVRNTITGEIYEITMGDLYAQKKSKYSRKN